MNRMAHTDANLGVEQGTVIEFNKEQVGKKKAPGRVLIIDDNPFSANRLKTILEDVGFSVTIHTKSFGAISAIIKERPDLILLDFDMRLLDGPTLCSLIKNNLGLRQFSAIPIFFLTTTEREDLLENISDCQATGYIVKNWQRERVISTLAKQFPTI